MTQILESVRIALDAIWTNKLRSLMTVAGNIVAVTSIVTVVSLIQGMNATVTATLVDDVGSDTFVVQRVPPVARTQDEVDRNRNNPLLTRTEADAVRQFGRETIESVLVQAQRRDRVALRELAVDNVQVQGVTAEYLDFPTFDVERGRMMSTLEVERGRPVAIIGADVAESLFGPTNPLEVDIRVGGVPFRVVGVSAPKGAFFGQSQDDFVVIPLSAYERLYGTRQNLRFSILPRSPELRPAAMDDATVALRVSRRLQATEADNFGIFTSNTLLDIYDQATSGIFAVLVGVVALSLLVGGIVIMNIMLMVVSERTREIGLRKALGARQRDIMSQVLTESVTLSTVGGLAGIALGFLVAQGIAAISPLPATLEPWSIALGVGVTAGVGLFFGAYPARQAARLDPIEALRRE
jgi:putative ABC transport system permease protein